MVFLTVRARGRMFLFFLPERGIFISINFPRTICRWLVAVWLHVLWKYFHTLRAKKNKKIETMNLYFFCRILKIGTSVKIKSQYVCFFFWNKIPWIFFFFFLILHYIIRNAQNFYFESVRFLENPNREKYTSMFYFKNILKNR